MVIFIEKPKISNISILNKIKIFLTYNGYNQR